MFIVASVVATQALTFKSLIMNSELKLTSIGISYLNQARKWTYFLSILGFKFTALIAIFALFFGSVLASFGQLGGGDMEQAMGIMGSGFITVLYLIIALLYFFLSLYLYRFSARTKAAIHGHNSAQLEDGLKNLKSYWKLAGILTVVVLSLYVLFFVFSILFGAAAFAGL